jgi:PAS domain S-box-containing protein
MAVPTSLGVLLDHAQDKITLIDEEGQFTYANAATERILGWKPEEIIGQSAFDYIHPEDIDKLRTAFDRTINADAFTVTTAKFRYKAKDGSWVWLESRMANVTDEQLDGYVVSSRDVTDRVEAQAARREITQRLEELTATTGEILWLFNKDWSELLFVNPAYENVMGQSTDTVRADPTAFLDAIHPEDVPAVKDAMNRLSSGQSVDIEYRVNPNKNYRTWVWVQGEPIIKDGEVVRISGFSRDVTDRYRRVRQLYVMDNLLRHNLRNDMNIILGNAELIRKESPEVADKTKVIRRTAENLLASAEKEREIITVLTGRVNQKHIDLGEVVIAAAETVQDRYPEASIDISLSESTSVYALDHIQFAVIELLENAIMHGESDQPEVRISTRPEDDQMAIIVEDNGPPIPDIETQVLTGGHEMTDIYHSTGLGLWLVYWVVELSNGQITVKSANGQGNRIWVGLPRDRE